MSDWYRDWQNLEHATRFDGRSLLDPRNLLRNYEAFNDVRLLRERLDATRAMNVLEVGCATGEFSRYLGLRFPQASYYGLDISQPAIERARTKYPSAHFCLIEPSLPVSDGWRRAGLPLRPELIYSKDVVQHQTKPFDFLEQLVREAAETTIVRLRTRDVGPSELDPERSCQYHYGGWMPYLVLNIEELVAHLRRFAPTAEIVVYRHHMVLGGWHGRYVPKELFLESTGTAETAVGIFKRTTRPDHVTIEDRPDHDPAYTWDYTARRALRRALSTLWGAGTLGRRRTRPAETVAQR